MTHNPTTRRLAFCDVCGAQARPALRARARCRDCGGQDELLVHRLPELQANARRIALRVRFEDYQRRARA